MRRPHISREMHAITAMVMLFVILAPTSALGAPGSENLVDLRASAGGHESAGVRLAPAGSGSVSGTVFFDANGDGARGLDEGGIADVTVELWDSPPGAAARAATTTASDGTFLFAGVDAAAYVVVQTDSPGYVSTTTNSRTVVVGSVTISGVDFGDTLLFTLTGTVYDDRNGNGIQTPDEPGIPDVPMEVFGDLNANGMVDTGEPLLGSTATDAQGVYRFHNLLPGYRVLRIWPFGGSSSPGGNQIGVYLLSSNDGMGVNFYRQNFPLLPATGPAPACAYYSSIVSNFNNTAIDGGRTIWFTSRLKATGVGPAETTVYFENASVQFPAGGTTYELTMPRAKVVFSPSATTTSTVFDVPTQTWVTTVSPAHWGKELFLSGLAFVTPQAGLPGGIKPVTMGGRLASDKLGLRLEWSWAAAVYTSFSSDHTALGVKPVSENSGNPYNNADPAGTPENFKSFVTAGARGGGGSNYTGGDTPRVRGTCAAAAAPPFLQRVNCGSVTYTDVDDNVWSADRKYSLGAWGYLEGGAKSSSSPMPFTSDPFLYQKYRERPGEYRFTVPNGDYDVALKLAEFSADSAAERTIQISLEGSVVEPAMSVFALAGKYQPLDVTYTASVADGVLNIGFAKGDGSQKEPVVSAIEVATHMGDTPPPATPTPTPTVTPTPTATPAPYSQTVNSGSVTYTDEAGEVWTGDKSFKTGAWGFTGGAAKAYNAAVSGTTDDILYQRLRENPHEYRFTVPNGTYEVTLRFADFVATKPTDRIMQIKMEGNVIETGLNVFSEVGQNAALDRVYTVVVADGVLSIAFIKAGGSAKEPIVNAIRVRSQ